MCTRGKKTSANTCWLMGSLEGIIFNCFTDFLPSFMDCLALKQPYSVCYNVHRLGFGCTSLTSICRHNLNCVQTTLVCVRVLPCRTCEVDSAKAPQFDWTKGPRIVMRELPRLVSAALSGATWLNCTEERQPTKPLEAAFVTSSPKLSIPAERRVRGEKTSCCMILFCESH